MTASNWANAYARERVYEGGNVDDPQDPGGRTSRGVIQRVYDAWRRRRNLRPRDVYKADDSEIEAIFKEQYWAAVYGDKLPAGINLVVFDGAVNSGPKQSIKWLQAGLNARRKLRGAPAIVVDGQIGNATLDALEEDSDNDALIAAILSLRLAFLKQLKTWSRFGKGWSARLASVKAIGQAWASGSVGPAPADVQPQGGHQKAPVSALKEASVSVQGGAAMTGGGLTLAGATDAVQSAAGQVQAVSDISAILHWLFIALTIAGVLLTLYAAWRIWKAERAKQGEVAASLDALPDAAT